MFWGRGGFTWGLADVPIVFEMYAIHGFSAWMPTYIGTCSFCVWGQVGNTNVNVNTALGTGGFLV